jgi:orotidine-5'-phosphate decarboxylase
MKPHEHIILPLDVPTIDKAVSMVELLKNEVGVFKVGLELINSAESTKDTLALLTGVGASRIFLDAKLHDIPNTVAGAMRGVVRSGAWCVTVHTMGGKEMLQAATEAARCEAEALGLRRPLVLGVTVLTSISEAELRYDLHVNSTMTAYTTHLALMAHEAGCDGVIASPAEIQALRTAIPSRNFLIVTPGVRPAGTDRGDQARVHTPAEAIMWGADYLVIGRPINASPDPELAARSIAREIESAWDLV